MRKQDLGAVSFHFPYTEILNKHCNITEEVRFFSDDLNKHCNVTESEGFFSVNHVGFSVYTSQGHVMHSCSQMCEALRKGCRSPPVR